MLNVLTNILIDSKSILLWILKIFGIYRIFEKAGIEGWKALIPFYREYILFTQIAKIKKEYFIAYMISFCVFIPFLILLILGGIGLWDEAWRGNGFQHLNMIYWILLLISSIGMFIGAVARYGVLVYAYYKTFQKFGKDNNLSLILAIFSLAGILFIALDQSKYETEKELAVLDQSRYEVEKEPTIEFCSACGTKVQGKFCIHCGREIK